MDDFVLKRPPNLARMVATKISEEILSGRFKPGERLLEASIAARLDISRASLREALRTLEADGLVTIRQNRGAHVVNPSSDEIEQMTLFRAVTESTAAYLVTSHRDEASLRHLASIVERQKQVVAESHDRAEFLRVHWEFHDAICRESKNVYLARGFQLASNNIRIYHHIKALVGPAALRNNIVYLDVMSHGSPEEAQDILRSQIILAAYDMLEKDIPHEIRNLVTCYIDKKSKIIRIDKAKENAFRHALDNRDETGLRDRAFWT